MFSVTAKFLWFLDTLHFNISASALDQHQSLFGMFCECLTCTMPMIKLFDSVILSGIAASGKYSTISVWGKSCFDLCGCCAAALPALWLRMMPNPSQALIAPAKTCHRCRIYDTYSSMNFLSRLQSLIFMSLDGARPAKLLRRHVG